MQKSRSLHCSRCRERIAPGSARCGACGQAIARESLEMRQGTFLFCDLVGSTRLLNSLQPDAQVEVMDAVRVAVQAVWERLGGRAERFDGDGYFISFVGPDSHEDDAVVAIRVGLAIVRDVQAAGEAIGRQLRMRVGIASGPVVVGYPEESATVRDEGYIGTAINRAKRLVGAAPAGRVLVAEETQRLAGRFFDYEAGRELVLDGFDAPVTVFLVTGPGALASRFLARGDASAAVLLVARERETTILGDAWRRSVAGERTAVQLWGEAGIGKSSLAHWIGSHAQRDGARIVDLDCTSRTQHTPFYPVALRLRYLAGVADDVDATAAVARVRDWIATVSDEAQALALAPWIPTLLMQVVEPGPTTDQNVAHAVAAFAAWFTAWASARPILVRVEDVQWADAATRDLLQALVDGEKAAPLMTLATTRERAPAARSEDEVRIELGAVDDVAAAQIVRHIVGADEALAETVDRVVRIAEGIPFYLELVASAEAAGGLTGAMKRGASLPTMLEMLVQARIDRLPPLRPVVQMAAILGREFALPILEQLVSDPAALAQAATRILDEGLWERQPDDPDGTRLRFKHALIHDAVYESHLPSERRQLHLRVAELLKTKLGQHPAATKDVIGHHLGAGGRFEEAATCYLEAADIAVASGAFRDAAAHCREGIELCKSLPAGPASRRLGRRLHLQLGVAAAATLGYAADEVESAYKQALAQCDVADDPDALFPIVRLSGTFHFVRARFDAAHRIGLECLDLGGRSGRVEHTIEALSFLGYTELYRGRLAQARDALERCIEAYRREGGEQFRYPSPQDAGTTALSLLGTVAWLQGDCQAANRAASEALRHAGALARPIDEAYALVWVSMLRNLQRRSSQACELADRCIAISDKHKFATWLAAATMQRCIAESAVTALPQSVGMLQHVLGLFKQQGAEANAAYFEWGVARGHLRCGEAALATDALGRAWRASEGSGESYLRAELLILEGEMAVNDPARARRSFEQAFQLARAQGAWLLALRASAAWLALRGIDLAGSPPLELARAVLEDGGAVDPPSDGWAAAAVARAGALMA